MHHHRAPYLLGSISRSRHIAPLVASVLFHALNKEKEKEEEGAEEERVKREGVSLLNKRVKTIIHS
jgi:hypothetical protein